MSHLTMERKMYKFKKHKRQYLENHKYVFKTIYVLDFGHIKYSISPTIEPSFDKMVSGWIVTYENRISKQCEPIDESFERNFQDCKEWLIEKLNYWNKIMNKVAQ